MPVSTTYDFIVRVFRKKWTFLATFLVVFFVSLSGLIAIGEAPSFVMPERSVVPFLPHTSATSTATSVLVPKGSGDLPIGIDIPEVGVKANVSNPNSTDVDTLDAALLKGAVRYPTSAKLGEAGNVIIFGHSSHLPIVHNQSFKAFNEIGKLTEGDPIYVYSAGRRYTYAVETVERTNTDTGAIPLIVDGSKLTLATCDNFGQKSDRFVVTAKLVTVEEAAPAE